jgi:S-disulfanyl-L-cysteine oxidoreductase SoxD
MRGKWSGRAWRLGAAGLLAAGLWGTVAEPAVRAQTPDQVAAGAQVYSASCANCHGARGEGRGPDDPDAPLLVGPRGLTGFRHGLELFEFVRDSMPQDQPGSLTADQYWAVSAWLLSQNSIAGPSAPLGPDNAAGVSLRR